MVSGNWFNGLQTVDEIKKQYRRLAMEWHPDRNKSPQATATMQLINAAYHAALKAMDLSQTTDATGEQHTYYYNEQREQEVMDKLGETLAVKSDVGMNVVLMGRWLWVSFEDKPSKETREAIKALGYQWHSKRNMWYWHMPTYKKTVYSGLPMGELARRYGYKEHGVKASEPEEKEEQPKGKSKSKSQYALAK